MENSKNIISENFENFTVELMLIPESSKMSISSRATFSKFSEIMFFEFSMSLFTNVQIFDFIIECVSHVRV